MGEIYHNTKTKINIGVDSVEELMTVKEYARQNPKISVYRLRNWMKNGMKHLPEKPFLIKPKWVEEYIESCVEEPIVKTKKKKLVKLPTRNDMKITMEDLM